MRRPFASPERMPLPRVSLNQIDPFDFRTHEPEINPLPVNAPI